MNSKNNRIPFDFKMKKVNIDLNSLISKVKNKSNSVYSKNLSDHTNFTKDLDSKISNRNEEKSIKKFFNNKVIFNKTNKFSVNKTNEEVKSVLDIFLNREFESLEEHNDEDKALNESQFCKENKEKQKSFTKISNLLGFNKDLNAFISVFKEKENIFQNHKNGLELKFEKIAGRKFISLNEKQYDKVKNRKNTNVITDTYSMKINKNSSIFPTNSSNNKYNENDSDYNVINSNISNKDLVEKINKNTDLYTDYQNTSKKVMEIKNMENKFSEINSNFPKLNSFNVKKIDFCLNKSGELNKQLINYQKVIEINKNYNNMIKENDRKIKKSIISNSDLFKNSNPNYEFTLCKKSIEKDIFHKNSLHNFMDEKCIIYSNKKIINPYISHIRRDDIDLEYLNKKIDNRFSGYVKANNSDYYNSNFENSKTIFKTNQKKLRDSRISMSENNYSSIIPGISHSYIKKIENNFHNSNITKEITSKENILKITRIKCKFLFNKIYNKTKLIIIERIKRNSKFNSKINKSKSKEIFKELREIIKRMLNHNTKEFNSNNYNDSSSKSKFGNVKNLMFHKRNVYHKILNKLNKNRIHKKRLVCLSKKIIKRVLKQEVNYDFIYTNSIKSHLKMLIN